ncbi:MAG: hypothetical protein ABSD57_03620 [Verrucomicrobiota bacterium]|jgi:uncharacterized protein involved in outer membrane biogenesis
MKWLFKWLFRLFLLAVVLVVILLLSLNSILRVVIENRIRAQTGMDAEIGKFSLGLASPAVTIKDLKIYNPPSFGGTLFLDIPEIHVEYDRAALARHEIHVTLMRFNLGELDIVKNEAGQTNIFSLGVLLPAKKSGGGGAGFKKRTGCDFKSIDVLNVSVGTVKFIDLKNQRNNREQTIGLDNLVLKNVKSQNDLAGLAVLVALRGGDFWGSLLAPPKPGAN